MITGGCAQLLSILDDINAPLNAFQKIMKCSFLKKNKEKNTVNNGNSGNNGNHIPEEYYISNIPDGMTVRIDPKEQYVSCCFSKGTIINYSIENIENYYKKKKGEN